MVVATSCLYFYGRFECPLDVRCLSSMYDFETLYTLKIGIFGASTDPFVLAISNYHHQQSERFVVLSKVDNL